MRRLELLLPYTACVLRAAADDQSAKYAAAPAAPKFKIGPDGVPSAASNTSRATRRTAGSLRKREARIGRFQVRRRIAGVVLVRTTPAPNEPSQVRRRHHPHRQTLREAARLLERLSRDTIEDEGGGDGFYDCLVQGEAYFSAEWHLLVLALLRASQGRRKQSDAAAKMSRLVRLRSGRPTRPASNGFDPPRLVEEIVPARETHATRYSAAYFIERDVFVNTSHLSDPFCMRVTNMESASFSVMPSLKRGGWKNEGRLLKTVNLFEFAVTHLSWLERYASQFGLSKDLRPWHAKLVMKRLETFARRGRAETLGTTRGTRDAARRGSSCHADIPWRRRGCRRGSSAGPRRRRPPPRIFRGETPRSRASSGTRGNRRRRPPRRPATPR